MDVVSASNVHGGVPQNAFAQHPPAVAPAQLGPAASVSLSAESQCPVDPPAVPKLTRAQLAQKYAGATLGGVLGTCTGVAGVVMANPVFMLLRGISNIGGNDGQTSGRQFGEGMRKQITLPARWGSAGFRFGDEAGKALFGG